MPDRSRREFLQRTSLALSALTLPGCASEAPPRAPAANPGELDGPLLQAMAAAVLPSTALGAAGVERAVREFRAWLAAYEPVPELMHGYGDAEIRYGPPDPAPGWAAQLRGLDIEARRRFHAPLASLALDRRREILRAHVAAERDGRLPTPLEARHVAVALMSHFYSTPAATDLCYGARIGPETCRPLSTSPERPAPLGAES